MRLGVEAALVEGRLVRGDVELLDGRVAGYGLDLRERARDRRTRLRRPPGQRIRRMDLFEADADGYRRAGEALLETGVTAYLPTFITAPEPQLLATLRDACRGAPASWAFISKARSSPSAPRDPPDRRATDPDEELLASLLDAGPSA